MKEQRRNIRIACAEKCVLHLRNWLYLASVKNISFGGALVQSPIHDLHVGDYCKVTMDGTTIREYSCKIVRVDAVDVALTFTDMHILPPVV